MLVDTGFGAADCADPTRVPRHIRALSAPRFVEGETAIRQVEALGFDSRDVRHIVTTHLDFDHAGGLGDFPDANVHAFGDELAAALHPSLRESARYVQAGWAHGPKWVEYEAGGDSWFGFQSVRVIPELDAEIALIPLLGHSTGHCGVAIGTASGWLLDAGDSFYFHGEIETPPSCPPGLRVFQALGQHDGKARHHNQDRLRELKRAHGDEVAIFCAHDARMLDDFPPRSGFVDESAGPLRS